MGHPTSLVLHICLKVSKGERSSSEHAMEACSTCYGVNVYPMNVSIKYFRNQKCRIEHA